MGPLRVVHCVCGDLQGLCPTCHLRRGLFGAVGISKAAEQTAQSVSESGGLPSGAATSRGAPHDPPVGGQELFNPVSAASSKVGGGVSARLGEVPETIRAG